MQVELRNPLVTFISLCDVRKMLIYSFELLALFHGVFEPYTEERNVV